MKDFRRSTATVGDVIATRAEEFGEKTCLIVAGRSISYQDLHDASTRVATALRDIGVGKGDTAAIYAGNSLDGFTAWIGINKAGATEASINVALTKDLLHHQLDVASVTAVFSDPAYVAEIAEVADRLPNLRHVILWGLDDGDPLPDCGGSVEVHRFTTFLATVPHESAIDASTAWNDPAVVMFTSGTTGPSKGALLPHSYVIETSYAEADMWHQGPDDVMFTPCPFYHISAKLCVGFASILVGSTAVISERFSVSETWDIVDRYQVTGMLLIGSMILMLWDLPVTPDDASRPVRTIIGAPIPPDLHLAIEERYQLRALTAYGMSEVFPLTMATIDHASMPGSCGRQNPAFEVRLVDDDDFDVPIGEVGEIVCRPLHPHIMFDRYTGDADATLRQMRNLWFHTGDSAKRDEDGNFFFVDRKKDALRRRGENISSFEVERAVMQHPDVELAAAHAVPSDLMEDDVKICVVARAGATIDPVSLIDHCVEHLPRFAVPRYVEVMDALPQNAVGRILKNELRDRGVTDATWDRESVGYELPRRG